MGDKLIDHVPTEQIDSLFFHIPNFLDKLPNAKTILLILFFTGIFMLGLWSESKGKKWKRIIFWWFLWKKYVLNIGNIFLFILYNTEVVMWLVYEIII